jgi:hypothetical protein
VRRALFNRLFGHIKQLVVVRGFERDTLTPIAILQIVVDREAIDEARQIVLTIAGASHPVRAPF